jgi:hypothetical protein
VQYPHAGDQNSNAHLNARHSMHRRSTTGAGAAAAAVIADALSTHASLAGQSALPEDFSTRCVFYLCPDHGAAGVSGHSSSSAAGSGGGSSSSSGGHGSTGSSSSSSSSGSAADAASAALPITYGSIVRLVHKATGNHVAASDVPVAGAGAGRCAAWLRGGSSSCSSGASTGGLSAALTAGGSHTTAGGALTATGSSSSAANSGAGDFSSEEQGLGAALFYVRARHSMRVEGEAVRNNDSLVLESVQYKERQLCSSIDTSSASSSAVAVAGSPAGGAAAALSGKRAAVAVAGSEDRDGPARNAVEAHVFTGGDAFERRGWKVRKGLQCAQTALLQSVLCMLLCSSGCLTALLSSGAVWVVQHRLWCTHCSVQLECGYCTAAATTLRVLRRSGRFCYCCSFAAIGVALLL